MRFEALSSAQLFSLLKRDFTIIAKTHHDLARHYRAVAGTCSRALDATPADMLPVPSRGQDGGALKHPSLDFGSGSPEDHD